MERKRLVANWVEHSAWDAKMKEEWSTGAHHFDHLGVYVFRNNTTLGGNVL